MSFSFVLNNLSYILLAVKLDAWRLLLDACRLTLAACGPEAASKRKDQQRARY
jgi:hypothetical protein